MPGRPQMEECPDAVDLDLDARASSHGASGGPKARVGLRGQALHREITDRAELKPGGEVRARFQRSYDAEATSSQTIWLTASWGTTLRGERPEPPNQRLNREGAVRPTKHRRRWQPRKRPWWTGMRGHAELSVVGIPVASDEQDCHWNFCAKTRRIPLLNGAPRPI
jgi:hypothetical protein